MCVLFIVSAVSDIAENTSYWPLVKAYNAGNTEAYNRLVSFHNAAYDVKAVALMSGHWVFGI